VVVEAIERGLIDPNRDGGVDPVDAVDEIRASGIDRRFFREWWNRFDAVRSREYELESVDADALVGGMWTVMEHHLASSGHK
jgi:hypothetical protein